MSAMDSVLTGQTCLGTRLALKQTLALSHGPPAARPWGRFPGRAELPSACPPVQGGPRSLPSRWPCRVGRHWKRGRGDAMEPVSVTLRCTGRSLTPRSGGRGLTVGGAPRQRPSEAARRRCRGAGQRLADAASPRTCSRTSGPGTVTNGVGRWLRCCRGRPAGTCNLWGRGTHLLSGL